MLKRIKRYFSVLIDKAFVEEYAGNICWAVFCEGALMRVSERLVWPDGRKVIVEFLSFDRCEALPLVEPGPKHRCTRPTECLRKTKDRQAIVASSIRDAPLLDKGCVPELP